MEYSDFKPHEADAFELDHVIVYTRNPRNLIREMFWCREVNLENFLPWKLPAIWYITQAWVSYVKRKLFYVYHLLKYMYVIIKIKCFLL